MDVEGNVYVDIDVDHHRLTLDKSRVEAVSAGYQR
jgi:hypothetical protein